MDSWAIRCDAEFEWPEFAGALKEALMSPSQEVLVKYVWKIKMINVYLIFKAFIIALVCK